MTIYISTGVDSSNRMTQRKYPDLPLVNKIQKANSNMGSKKDTQVIFREAETRDKCEAR